MHEREIPGFTRIGSTADQPPRALRVRSQSPQAEAEAFTDALGDPATEPPAWSPLSGVSARISGYLDHMAQAGKRILSDVADVARETAAATQSTFEQAYEEGAILPGEEFAIAGTQLARRAGAAIPPYSLHGATPRSCGTITTSDGRVFQVPCAEDNVTQGERSRADLLKNALRPGNYDAALERAKLQLAARKEQADQEQFDRTFALKERQAAVAEDLGELQVRAAELALERETSSPAQRALWGRPSTISPEPPVHRAVKRIGPGVPGGIQERLF